MKLTVSLRVTSFNIKETNAGRLLDLSLGDKTDTKISINFTRRAVVLTDATRWTMSDRGPSNSSWKGRPG
ncbi:hypothetical protein TNCV_2580581 [Trichonephila clavipes]|uniref:Uncharacterized protein n=1 Tax=Trichonephila clavipes TaxID=2585209 RepID=A0A8X6S987_TRICX|nr:hypothetical protein TNCV_2580581 [Trichonephila clavipes]